ncbi:MAG: hypothetical protein AB1489_29955 [Acidobacteriota bacterium]
MSSDKLYKLRIFFEGLCAFVEDENQFFVFLPDARIPGYSSVETHKKRFLPHLPAILFAADDVKQQENEFDYFTKAGDYAWMLDGDDLKLDGDFAGLGLSVTDNFRTMVPSMAEIYQNEGGLEVKKELFKTDTQELDSCLVARMILTTGKIDAQFPIATHEFKDRVGVTKHTMALARDVFCDITARSPQVKI